jgi:predicted PurR-regulated permease PerM
LGVLVAIPLASFMKDMADSWRNGEFNKTAVDSEYLQES